jgi:Cu(I)/Ag(I) efflux system membrane fusion protein
MPLVTAESLGYVGDAPEQHEAPLVIPVSGALRTGKRAVVYVKQPDTEKPTFEGREVVLGPRAGDYYLVRDGLEAGELVVVKGNFKLDAELQIQARPSMMSLTPEPAMQAPTVKPVSLNPELKQQLAPLLTAYFDMQQALAADDADQTVTAVTHMTEALPQVDMSLFDMDTHTLWMRSAKSLNTILDKMSAGTDIAVLREQFMQASQVVIGLSKALGPLGTETAYIMHCPMAFDNQGADWLQDNDNLVNPYFGEIMLKCGSITEVIGGKD